MSVSEISFRDFYCLSRPFPIELPYVYGAFQYQNYMASKDFGKYMLTKILFTSHLSENGGYMVLRFQLLFELTTLVLNFLGFLYLNFHSDEEGLSEITDPD